MNIFQEFTEFITKPYDKKIVELEAANEQFKTENTGLKNRIAELEKELKQKPVTNDEPRPNPPLVKYQKKEEKHD